MLNTSLAEKRKAALLGRRITRISINELQSGRVYGWKSCKYPSAWVRIDPSIARRLIFTLGLDRKKNGLHIFIVFIDHHVWAGAIIGDGDRKRAPFLVLGLAPWYGTIFLFLEQIAPSPFTHARTCCEEFCGWRAGEMASKIPEIFYAFGPQHNALMSVGILLKYFRRKLLQFWMK